LTFTFGDSVTSPQKGFYTEPMMRTRKHAYSVAKETKIKTIIFGTESNKEKNGLVAYIAVKDDE
jgi:hypothetical protein